MTPETLALTAYRNVPFLEEYQFTESGTAVDLTGCTGEMQIRLYGKASGSALISLANVASNTEGVWISDPEAGILQVHIAEASLDALPAASTLGASRSFSYDLVITWADGFEEIFLTGTLTLEPGVTT